MFATIVNLAFCTALATTPAVLTQSPVERVIQGATTAEPLNLEGLLSSYCLATGGHVSTDTQTRMALKEVPVVSFGGSRTLSGTAFTQHVESLLAHNGFVLSVLPGDDTYWLSNPSRDHLYPKAHYVSESDMDYIEGHPAVMMRVTISLKNVDVRQLSNTLRPLMQEHWQQALSMGDSRTVLLSGTGAELVSMIQLLRTVEKSEVAGKSSQEPVVETAKLAPAVQVAPLVTSKVETRILAIPSGDARGIANTVERLAKDRFNAGPGAVKGSRIQRPSFHRSAADRRMLVRGVSAELDLIEADLALAVQLHSEES